MDLIPIGQAAQRLGLKPSALRYYDERGLVSPPARPAGRRMYGSEELRRLAFIKIAQRLRLSLDTAAAVLDAPGPQWRHTVRDQVAELDEVIAQAQSAQRFLAHALNCPADHPVRECAARRPAAALLGWWHAVHRRGPAPASPAAAPADPIPPVRDPKNLAGTPACQLLASGQLAANRIDLPSKPKDVLGAPGCQWNDKAHTREIRVFVVIGPDVLHNVYAQRETFAVFEVTQAAGHPAIRTKDNLNGTTCLFPGCCRGATDVHYRFHLAGRRAGGAVRAGSGARRRRSGQFAAAQELKKCTPRWARTSTTAPSPTKTIYQRLSSGVGSVNMGRG